MAATSRNGDELHQETVDLATGVDLGSTATVLPDGNLRTHQLRVHADGERPVVNTETRRKKHRNVERDPRVTLTIRDGENPYRYAEVRAAWSRR